MCVTSIWILAGLSWESECGASASSDPEGTRIRSSRPAGTTGAERRVDALSESVREAVSRLGLWGANSFRQRKLSAHELDQGVKAVTYLWLRRRADGLGSRRVDFCRAVMRCVAQGRVSWQRVPKSGLWDYARSLEYSTSHSAAGLKHRPSLPKRLTDVGQDVAPRRVWPISSSWTSLTWDLRPRNRPPDIWREAPISGEEPFVITRPLRRFIW